MAKQLDRSGVADRVDGFLAALQAKSDAHYEEHFAILPKPKFTAVPGNRYVKIVKQNGQTMVHCFIDRTNGDILKAASWKAPAKHARGNVFADDYGMSGVSEYGANYL